MAHILVVDDNSVNLDLILYLLRAHGHDVHGVCDASAAFEKLLQGGFELVLTDILMPDVDGYEFARRVRADARVSSIPLVAVTALAMPSDRERIRQGGFVGCITKPIEPRTFVEQVVGFLPAGPA
jgi:CheY-like chemotaxis protein